MLISQFKRQESYNYEPLLFEQKYFFLDKMITEFGPQIYYIAVFLITVILTTVFTLATRAIALKLNIFDNPDNERKIHKQKIPLLGGVAIFFSFFLVLFLVRDQLVAGDLEFHHWFGFFIGACFLVVGGYLDDKYNLNPGKQVIWPILASICVIVGGVGIEKITNPLGGFVYLDTLKVPIISLAGEMRYFVIISDLFILLWLMGMMYTTKLLDGIDGLVSGVTAIGGLIIFVFTMTTRYFQPDIGLAALILFSACIGFLIFNWYPAKIFLGEGGSLLLGYILGVLAIISGGKIAIALLVMGIPILDVLWTIIRRLKNRKNPFRFADRKHLHFRLLDLGLSQRKTVLIYYTLATLFGFSAVFLQSIGKVLALSFLIVLMLFIVVSFNFIDKKIKN